MNKKNMMTPLEAFMKWFDNIPVTLRRHLAHIFNVCTTDDAAQMAASLDQSLDRFTNWVLKIDFPLRTAARMFYVRSIFDMIIFHYKEILVDNEFLQSTLGKDNILQISPKQWEEILKSWKELRQMQMADIFIHTWASWMIKMQMEAK